MDEAIEGKIKWTLIIRDPLDNSFIAPRNNAQDNEEDPQLQVKYFTRSAEEDSDFGIDHLREHGTGMEPHNKEHSEVENKLDALDMVD